VITSSSLSGIVTLPTQGAYNASRFVVRGYTGALRMELELELELEGVTVCATCVDPGRVATNIATYQVYVLRFHRKMQKRSADKSHAVRSAQAAASTHRDIA
jgi:short-subunit dehydrogenase